MCTNKIKLIKTVCPKYVLIIQFLNNIKNHRLQIATKESWSYWQYSRCSSWFMVRKYITLTEFILSIIQWCKCLYFFLQISMFRCGVSCRNIVRYRLISTDNMKAFDFYQVMLTNNATCTIMSKYADLLSQGFCSCQ